MALTFKEGLPRMSGWGLGAKGGQGELLMFAPVALGFIVGLCSLILGCSPGYFALQVMMFAMITPMLYMIRNDDRFVGSSLLISFLKIFYISQLICLPLMRAPDAGLNKPLITVGAMLVGILSAFAGVGLARLAVSALPRFKPILSFEPTAANLRKLAIPCAVIGLSAQGFWSVYHSLIANIQSTSSEGINSTSSGLSIFGFIAPLAILAICCFAGERLTRTGGKKMISRDFLLVLLTFLALIAPLAQKTEPLQPVVALAVIAIIYRWRPSLALVAVAIFVVFFVAEFLYPTITMSRLRSAADHRPLPVVYFETVSEAVSDPNEFLYIKELTHRYDAGERNYYFGTPSGFWDRFTPMVTDKLITSGQYTKSQGLKPFIDAAASIPPRTLGFNRDIRAEQAWIEENYMRHRNPLGEVHWENTGFIGEGYLSGGFATVIGFMLSYGFLASLAARFTFGVTGQKVIWIPFLVQFMLHPAGAAFAQVAPSFFWGWVLLAAAIWFLLKVLFKPPGAVFFGLLD